MVNSIAVIAVLAAAGSAWCAYIAIWFTFQLSKPVPSIENARIERRPGEEPPLFAVFEIRNRGKESLEVINTTLGFICFGKDDFKQKRDDALPIRIAAGSWSTQETSLEISEGEHALFFKIDYLVRRFPFNFWKKKVASEKIPYKYNPLGPFPKGLLPILTCKEYEKIANDIPEDFRQELPEK